MKILRALLLAVALVLVPTSSGAEPVTQAGSLDTNKDGKVDKAETAAAVSAEATLKDVLKDGKEVADAATIAKEDWGHAEKSGDRTAMMLVIATFLATLFKGLLSLLKMVSSNTQWFKTKDGKRFTKYSTLILGGLAGLAANIAFGVPMTEAFIVAASGPLSIAGHEYTKDSTDVPVAPPKVEEEAAGDA